MSTFERIKLDCSQVYVTLKDDPKVYKVIAAERKQMASVVVCYAAKTTDPNGEDERWDGLGVRSEWTDALYIEYGETERWVAMKKVDTTIWQDPVGDN